MMNDLLPRLSRQQCSDAFDGLRRNHKDELTSIVKAQATTTKRSAITVEQQFRWHQARSGYGYTQRPLPALAIHQLPLPLASAHVGLNHLWSCLRRRP